MTEEEWVNRLIDFAQLCRWLVTHFRPAWTARGYRTPVQGQAGFPDLVLVRAPRIEFIECKVASRVRPDQRLWLAALGACSLISPQVGVRLWTPSDWAEAQQVLR